MSMLNDRCFPKFRLDELYFLEYYICNEYICCGYKDRARSAFMSDILQNPGEFLPLTPAVFNILLALADGEKHGYGIMLEVEANTKGQVLMGPGTLYGSIKRMLQANLIEESDERPDPALDKQQRRYYRLTGLGRRTLHMEAERMAAQLNLARAKNVLAAEPFGSAR